ncbi:family 78 glycoside hydrolase catalytic domain [Niabella insulamsoli]|uniref:alpha-L-rhamnosidase n=1 Tax=Niabella insulamsoli TaxID=3144874 RepID=UPI0031FD86A0
MKYYFLFLKSLVVTAIFCFTITGTGSAQPIDGLTCEYQVQPLGIDVAQPRLGWQWKTDQPVAQTGYRVWVATSRQKLKPGLADVWDSEKQWTDSQLVYFRGSALSAHQRYWWRVELYTNGQVYRSEPTWFETAKMNRSEWLGKWITDAHDTAFSASPRFRKVFQAKRKVRSARCYISGLGYYQLYVNGETVNPFTLDPGFTDYSKRILYQTYDLTDQVKKGENCIGVQLGNGWFNEQTPTVWNFHQAPWRKRPQLLCEVRITYINGEVDIVKTDENWQTSTGPLQFDNIHAGTSYDARLEQEGWATAAFDDKTWNKARLTEATAPLLEAQLMSPVSVTDTIKVVGVKKISDTCYVFDMGVNFAGVPRLEISGAAGTTIRLRHAEMLDAAGRIDQRNINMHLRPRNERDVIQTDIYVLKGAGREVFVPAFTYHGFQYIEMTSNRPLDLQKIKLEGLRMHSDVAEIGNFTSSNVLLNKIFKICRNSYLSNLFGIPTDCPTREKNGWMADGFMVQEAGLMSYDAASIYAKWVKDMTDAQEANGDVPGIVPTSWRWDSDWAGPVWDAAIFIVPSLLYQYTNDLESMRHVYATAQRYLQYLATIENEKGLLSDGLGDWLYYKAITPKDFMVSCYYYWDYVLMSRMANALGKHDDKKQYALKAARLKGLINKHYFDPEKLAYANQTQLSYALPLYMGLVSDKHRDALARKLNEVIAHNNYSLDFGFIGSLIVPEVLSRFGYAETVYKMITKETLPSWGYWIKNYGATSLFETWDVGRNIGDASRNHPSMGAIAAWMYKYVAGLQMDERENAFKKIIIKPAFIKDLDFAEASHQSLYGTIRSSWKRIDGKLFLSVAIPASCTATIVGPGGAATEVAGGVHAFTYQE